MFHENFSSKVKFHAALILTSILFVYFLSTSTSPQYESLGDDSAIFQAVGAFWAQGYLPYVTLFENKGPLIFFIDAIGYTIAPRVGVMLLQIPAMYVALLFMWRTLGLYLSGKAKFVAATLTLVYYAMYYLDGNRTEEWSMPFLMASMYFFLRGLQASSTGKFFCPPLVGLINGLGFGACILLRTTNAMPLCCCVFLSAIFLIRDGEFKLLLKNFLNFCAGVAVMLLPFVMYFAAHDALYDALYGTILLNVFYSAQRANFLMTNFDDYNMYIAINFMPLYLLIATSIVVLLKSGTRLAVSGLFCSVMMLTLLMKLSPYPGYCALNVPLIPLFFAVTTILAKNFNAMWSAKGFSFKRVACKFLIVLLLIYPLMLTYKLSEKIIYINEEFVQQYHSNQNVRMLRLSELIPPEERDSVMMWGEGTYSSHWIFLTGIMPNCRFFSNVKAFAKVDPNVKREWLEIARTDSPQWMIYNSYQEEFSGDNIGNWSKNFRQNRDEDVEKLLRERYNLVAESNFYKNVFQLYRLKD